MSKKQLEDRINRLIDLYYRTGINLLEQIRSMADSPTRRRREQMLIQIDSILNELTAQAGQQQADILAMAYKLGVAENVAALQRQGVTAINESLQPLIHQEAVQAIMDESFVSILEASDNMAVDAKQRIEDVVRAANESSLVEGLSRRQATMNAIMELTQRQITGIVTASGARVPVDKYMANVIQFHQRKAHVTGSENIAIQNGYDLMYVNYVGITCEICARLQGRVYSISGQDKRFPPLTRRPPYHGHCIHSMTAWVEDAYPAAEVQSMIEKSNYENDNRSKANIQRYEERQQKVSFKNETRKQWLRYKARMPELPDLKTFASQKARNTAKYREWQEDFRKIGMLL